MFFFYYTVLSGFLLYRFHKVRTGLRRGFLGVFRAAYGRCEGSGVLKSVKLSWDADPKYDLKPQAVNPPEHWTRSFLKKPYNSR